MRAAGFGCDVFLRAPTRWSLRLTIRNAPAYGSNDAAVAVRRPLKKYLGTSVDSLAKIGLRLQVSSFGLRFLLVRRKEGREVWAVATRIDDIQGRGELEVLAEIRLL